MTDPIGPSYELSPSPATANVPKLAKQMQEQVTAFSENLQKILEDPSLSKHPDFLRKMTKDSSDLHLTVEKAIKVR